MFCPKCNTENDTDSLYCKSCRSQLKSSNEIKRCENGHILDPSWEQCPHCYPQNISLNLAEIDKPYQPIPVNHKEGISSKRKPTLVEDIINTGESNQELDSKAGKTIKEKETDTGFILGGWLVTFSRDPSGQAFEIREGRYIIGSDPNSAICILGDKLLSKKHGILFFRDGEFIIQDNMSANGTYVNSNKITGQTILKNNDEIKMGATIIRLIVL